jgi:hypothetical protein
MGTYTPVGSQIPCHRPDLNVIQMNRPGESGDFPI